MADIIQPDKYSVSKALDISQVEELLRITRVKSKEDDAKAIPVFEAGQALFSEKRYTEALKKYIEAALYGHLKSQRRLGVMYLEGLGCRKDYVSALKWLKVASERNDLHAQEQLAKMYRLGLGIEENLKIAVYWYHRSSELGGVQSTFELATCYEHGLGVLQNSDESIRLYMLAAEQGHSIARYHVGVAYECGLVLEQDVQEAIDWYILAIQGNNYDAKTRFWALVDEGIFVPESKEEAQFAEQVGLDLNDPVCLFKEAIRNMIGFDRPRDLNYFERVFKPYAKGNPEIDWRSDLWFRFDESKNFIGGNFSEFSRAQIFYGLANRNPKILWLLTEYYSIRIEFVRKFYFLIHLASLGSCCEAYYLGWYYHWGKDIVRDVKKAVFWLKKSAAECKNGREFGNLGFICEVAECDGGVGDPTDDDLTENSIEYFTEQIESAENYLRTRVELGKPNTTYDSSSCVKLASGFDPNRDLYIDYLTKSANNGYASAMYNLALELSLGISNEKSIEKEEYWLKKAVSAGSSDAMLTLAKKKERQIRIDSSKYVYFGANKIYAEKGIDYHDYEAGFFDLNSYTEDVDEDILTDVIQLNFHAGRQNIVESTFNFIRLSCCEKLKRASKIHREHLEKCAIKMFERAKKNLEALMIVKFLIEEEVYDFYERWQYGMNVGAPGIMNGQNYQIKFVENDRLEIWLKRINDSIEQFSINSPPVEEIKRIDYKGVSRRQRIEEKRSKEQEVSDMWYD